MSDAALPGVPELRPLAVGELVDAALKIWRRHLGPLVRAVVMVVTFFVQLPLLVALGSVDPSSFAGFLAAALSGIVTSVITTPFLATIFILVYFDLRVRKEGF